MQKKFLCQNMWRKEIDGVESNKEWNLVLEKLKSCTEIEESKEAILSENGKLVKASNF